MSPRMSSKKLGASGVEKVLSSEEQQTKVDEVLKVIGRLTDQLPELFSEASISRYLRVHNWHSRKAIKMLKETLKWKLEYKPERIRWEDIAHDAETGKIYTSKHTDKYGRTVLVIRPGFQNTSSTKRQIRFLVYCLENAIFTMPAGQEQMVWLIDFQGCDMSSISLKATHEAARILQNHYPERLGLVILHNPPNIIKSFGTMVKPFFNADTYNKVEFVYSNNLESQKIVEDLFDSDKLQSIFGGSNSISFDYKEFEKRMKEDDKKKSTLLGSMVLALPQEQLFVLERSESSVSDRHSDGSNKTSSSSDFAAQELNGTSNLSEIGSKERHGCKDGMIDAVDKQPDIIQLAETA